MEGEIVLAQLRGSAQAEEQISVYVLYVYQQKSLILNFFLFCPSQRSQLWLKDFQNIHICQRPL